VSQFASGDSGILQVTGELAQELNLRGIQPTRIEWIDEIITSTGRGGTMRTIVPADYPMLEKRRIVLPKRLENALRPEEWKPLITSSLLVRYWARARRRRILSTWLVFAVVIYVIIAAFTLPEELAQGSANLGIQILIAILVFIGTLIVMAALLSPKLHQEILFADKQAGERVGKEIFIDTLMKLEELGEDPSSVVRRFSRYRQPSIRERIDNLRVASPL